MITGEMKHHVQKDGDHYVHVIPDGGRFNIYNQIDGYPMVFLMAIPVHQTWGDEERFYTVQDAFELGWLNFDEGLFEEEE